MKRPKTPPGARASIQFLIQGSGCVAVGHPLGGQLGQRALEIHDVGVAVAGGRRAELGLVVDAVPGDDVLAAGGDRSADREYQSPLEGDLQESQDAPAQLVVRQVADAREADRVVRLARVGMLGALDSRWNAGNCGRCSCRDLFFDFEGIGPMLLR